VKVTIEFYETERLERKRSRPILRIILPFETEESHETSVRAVSAPAEIRSCRPRIHVKALPLEIGFWVICLEGMKMTAESHSEDGQSASRDSNPRLPTFEVGLRLANPSVAHLGL
jgi:hypothetical protein